jgi:putative FmdB family regulatory protein
VPTYVYACRGCEDRTEVVQKMSDAPLTTCTTCGGSLRRVLFPPAVVYKGSGFYTTDYKNGGRKSETDSASTSTDSSPAKSETKAETKTETKTEAKAAS